LLKTVNFPSYINRCSSILRIFHCQYLPLRSLIETKTVIVSKDTNISCDINKDNSFSILNQKPTIKRRVSNEFPQNNFELDKEKELMKMKIDKVINMKIINEPHLKEFKKKLENVELSLKTNGNKIMSENSITYQHANTLLKEIFNCFDFFLIFSRQFLNLSNIVIY